MTEFIKLKKSNCKNCYKCIRNCPVKSIRFSGNQAHIIADECILCGQCFVVCPQDAKVICDDTERARVLLEGDAPVIASVAPSFVANFGGVSIASFEAALKKLGFTSAEETAIGATIVSREYEKLISEGRQKVIISSCCPTVNLMIQKHFPAALPYLAQVMSPMQAHCRDIKRRFPNAKTIFIGPCISKKAEAEDCAGDVDCVLTFEELSEWLERDGITFDDIPDSVSGGRARNYPTSGGILRSMDCTSDKYSYLEVDGHRSCIAALSDIVEGELDNCFIEMSACSGSCIGGPVPSKHHHSHIRDFMTVSKYATNGDFDVELPRSSEVAKYHPAIPTGNPMPSESDITDILRKMGKTSPGDMLNCGSCGYNSCREKAIAVYQGKADLNMCLPFLKEKAETFSDNILKNTPNAIIVLNEQLEVQQINSAALRLFNIRRASDVVGDQVVRILDPTYLIRAQSTGKNVRGERVYLAEYGRYVDETIVIDRSYHMILCILRDITEEEQAREKKDAISRQTIEITDKVIEKQMRAVQEIASLLGETTAETKIALTKLKESLHDE